MAAIHSKNTKPEIYFRKLLFKRGYRYSLNSPKLPGHPDLYLRKYNTAVFVNGCFWHRHSGCKYTYMPKSRTEFWEKKFTDNINRDKKTYNELKELKIKCLVIWECTLKKMKKDSLYESEIMELAEQFLAGKEKFIEF